MLKPSECFAGPISNATGMSLIMPRTKYEHLALVVFSDDKKYAISLSTADQMHFMAFECEANDAWAGLHIPGVTIELDETSLTDSEGHYVPLSSMIRKADTLSVAVHFSNGMAGRGAASLPILSGLPACAERSSACFLKWQIVLGEGEMQRVLHRVDVTAAATVSK